MNLKDTSYGEVVSADVYEAEECVIDSFDDAQISREFAVAADAVRLTDEAARKISGPLPNYGNPTPSIIGFAPAECGIHSGPVVISIYGSGFTPESEVHWNGASRSSAFVEKTNMQVVLLQSDLCEIGVNIISVVNPQPGGGISNRVELDVIERKVAYNSSKITSPMTRPLRPYKI